MQKFDGKSVFQGSPQNESQSGKNFGYSKVTTLMLVSHFRGMLIVIFRRMNRNEEWQVIDCWFLTDSVLELVFLLNTPKTEIVYISDR